jgi:hypothetical protein
VTITPAGTGSGTVTGSGINCPGTCQTAVTTGNQVTLTESPATGSAFAGWTGGGCSGQTATCAVTMSAAESVTATFSKAAPPPPAKLTCSLKVTSSTIVLKKPKKGKPKTPVGDLVVSATCSQAVSAKVSATITATSKKHGKKKTKTFTITAQGSLAASKATAIDLKLSGGLLKLLKQKAKVSATLTLTVSNANGSATANASSALHGH